MPSFQNSVLLMAKTTHAERVLIGRIGAYVLHSRYDSREVIRPAREAFWSTFERDVDPDGVLTRVCHPATSEGVECVEPNARKTA